MEKDVCDILGYSNSRDALAKHVDDEDKNIVAIHDGIAGNPNQIAVNESGLYSLILSSRLPAGSGDFQFATQCVAFLFTIYFFKIIKTKECT